MKLKTVFLAAGVFIAALGVGALYYALEVYPYLVAGYGGSEPFTLSTVNGYTFILPVWTGSKVNVQVYANNTVQVWVEGELMGEGNQVFFDLEPEKQHLIMVTSEVPVEGRISFRQQPPEVLLLVAGFMVVLGVSIFIASFKLR